MVDFCCNILDDLGRVLFHTHITVENEVGVGVELILQGVAIAAVKAGVDMRTAAEVTFTYAMAVTPELKEAVALARKEGLFADPPAPPPTDGPTYH